MSTELNDQLLVLYECGVCDEFIIPPIIQCIDDHLFCFQCWIRWSDMTTCQVCRRAIDSTKCWNNQLEDFAEFMQLMFPCKYQGCGTRVMLNHLYQHQNSCPFRPTRSHVEYETISPPVPFDPLQNFCAEYQMPVQYRSNNARSCYSQQIQASANHHDVSGHVRLSPPPYPHPHIPSHTRSIELTRLCEKDKLSMAIPENHRNKKLIDELEEFTYSHICLTASDRDRSFRDLQLKNLQL